MTTCPHRPRVRKPGASAVVRTGRLVSSDRPYDDVVGARGKLALVDACRRVEALLELLVARNRFAVHHFERPLIERGRRQERPPGDSRAAWLRQGWGKRTGRPGTQLPSWSLPCGGHQSVPVVSRCRPTAQGGYRWRGAVARISARTTPVTGSRCTGTYRAQSTPRTREPVPCLRARGGRQLTATERAAHESDDHSSPSVRQDSPASPLRRGLSLSKTAPRPVGISPLPVPPSATASATSSRILLGVDRPRLAPRRERRRYRGVKAAPADRLHQQHGPSLGDHPMTAALDADTRVVPDTLLHLRSASFHAPWGVHRGNCLTPGREVRPERWRRARRPATP